MHIDQLHLHNFRNFENHMFKFPKQFTVVIGENGKGKSTILQGLRLAAGSFFLGLNEPERLHIQKEDVRRIDLERRFVPQRSCSFEAQGRINGNSSSVIWKRTLSRVNGRTDTKDAKEIIDYAEQLQYRVNEKMEDDIDLPVICFFSTARLWVEPKQTIKLKKKGSRLRDGYARCLDVKSDKSSPLEWIKSTYYKHLKGRDGSDLLEAVLEAIDICTPGWKPREWDEDTDDLSGDMTSDDGSVSCVPLYYLSDGLRTMAGMVAEIAYRCVTLNGHHGKDAVRNSKGIVMIDELDMHIHPNWQLSVVSDLKEAFPNLQFVVTTHSPFIVQSLNSDELINLDILTDISPKDLKIDEVATEIMLVETPYALENKAKYETAKNFLIDLNGQTSSKNLEQRLEQINDPGLRAFLELNKMAKGK